MNYVVSQKFPDIVITEKMLRYLSLSGRCAPGKSTLATALLGARPMSSPVVSPPAVDTRPVDDILRDIDVSLSPRQRMHVEALKKSYKGGFRSPRCKLLHTFESL
jgi:hypothetical protein